MKFKFATLAVAATVFLIGCSESQDNATQKKPQPDTTTNAQPLTAPSGAQKSTLETEQPAESKEALSKHKEEVTQEQLAQDAKSLAEALSYEGDETPREQLEQEIKGILEAATAESLTTEK